MKLMFAILMLIGVVAALPLQSDDYTIISRQTTVAQRKAYFATLSPARQSAAWRQHFAVEIAQHPELTADQRNVVALATALATTDTFTNPSSTVCAKDSVLGRALAANFPDDPLRKEIFGVLGPPVPQANHAVQGVGCNCKKESWCGCGNCFGGSQRGGGNCQPNDTGCGCFWLFTCNGYCL